MVTEGFRDLYSKHVVLVLTKTLFGEGAWNDKKHALIRASKHAFRYVFHDVVLILNAL